MEHLRAKMRPVALYLAPSKNGSLLGILATNIFQNLWETAKKPLFGMRPQTFRPDAQILDLVLHDFWRSQPLSQQHAWFPKNLRCWVRTLEKLMTWQESCETEEVPFESVRLTLLRCSCKVATSECSEVLRSPSFM